MAPVLETPRLLLRHFRNGDLAPLVAMNADPRVMELLGGPWSAERSAALLRWKTGEGARQDHLGMIAVERRGDGAFLGMAGLSRLDWFPDDVEVGWRLLPAYWGQGFATEAGRAWLDHAFRTMDVARVISVADVPNAPSRAVMERLGMRLDHVARLRDGEEEFDAAVHAISREAWEGGNP